MTVDGVTETETAGGALTVTVNVADLLGSAIEVAETIALTLAVTLAGASYSTEVLVCLLKEPGPVSFHVTPFPEGSSLTTAVIATDCPCPMDCELPPLKLTRIAGGGVLAPPPQPAKNALFSKMISIIMSIRGERMLFTACSLDVCMFKFPLFGCPTVPLALLSAARFGLTSLWKQSFLRRR